MKRILIAAALTLSLSAPVVAQEEVSGPYLYQLVAKQPFKEAMAVLSESVSNPPSLMKKAINPKAKLLAMPSKIKQIDGETYRLVMVCEPQMICVEYGGVFMFSKDGKRAWAAIREGDAASIFLGNPDRGQKKALDDFFDE